MVPRALPVISTCGHQEEDERQGQSYRKEDRFPARAQKEQTTRDNPERRLEFVDSHAQSFVSLLADSACAL